MISACGNTDYTDAGRVFLFVLGVIGAVVIDMDLERAGKGTGKSLLAAVGTFIFFAVLAVNVPDEFAYLVGILAAIVIVGGFVYILIKNSKK